VLHYISLFGLKRDKTKDKSKKIKDD